METASFSGFSPLGGRFSLTLPAGEAYKPRSGEADEPAEVMTNVIGPDYFKSPETPVLLGRESTDSDIVGRPKLAVINRTMARTYIGDANSLGRHFSGPGWRDDSSWLENIVVVQDVKSQGLREQMPAQARLRFLQSPEAGLMTLEIRSAKDPGKMYALSAEKSCRQAAS